METMMPPCTVPCSFVVNSAQILPLMMCLWHAKRFPVRPTQSAMGPAAPLMADSRRVKTPNAQLIYRLPQSPRYLIAYVSATVPETQLQMRAHMSRRMPLLTSQPNWYATNHRMTET